MMTRRSVTRLVVAVLAAALVPLAGVASAAPAAAVDTSTLPVDFSSTPIASWRADGPGSAVLVVGDVVYLGGTFTSVLNPAGTVSVARSNLAAFSLTTGALLTTFRADTNGQVRALAYDGTNLYAGGSFTTVNGTTRSRLVALDPSSGAVRTGWVANTNSHVFGLSVGGGRLYLSGSFTTVNNLSRQRLAAVSLSNGAVQPFSITADGTINTVAVTPAGDAVYIGGDFLTINGSAMSRLVRLTDDAAVVPMVWRDLAGPARDLEIDPSGTVLATGQAGAGNQGALFDTRTGVRLASQRCDGDGQAVHVIDGSFFSGFHEACAGDYTKRLVVNSTKTGVRDMTFQPTFDRFWGIWDIAGDRNHLVIACDCTRVSGVRAGGFAIFPPGAPDTVAPTAPTLTATPSSGRVDLSWSGATDDVAIAGYDVYRDDTLLGSADGTDFADTTVVAEQTYRYQVRAVDTSGNAGPLSAVAEATVPIGPPPPALSDSFTRANGAAWGSAWTTSTSAGTADVQGSAGRLALGTPAGAYARAVATGVPATADEEVLLSYAPAGTTPASYFSVYLRGSGGWSNSFRPRNGYGVQLSSGSSTVAVQKNVNGTLTTLASVSGGQRATTARQWLRFRVSGSAIAFRTWTDGTTEPSAWTWTGTDTGVTAGGQLHLSENRSSTASGAVTMSVDDVALSRL